MFDLRCERVLNQVCRHVVIGDASVTVENALLPKQNYSTRGTSVDARDSNWIRVGMGHRMPGIPPLLQMSQVLLRIWLARVAAQNRTSHSRVVFVCVHRRATVVCGLASQYPPKFCRHFAQAVSASAPHGAQANAPDPAWAATTQQVVPALRPPQCPDTLSIGGAIRCRRLGRPTTS